MTSVDVVDLPSRIVARPRVSAATPHTPPLSPLAFLAFAAGLFTLCVLLGVYLVFRINYPEADRAQMRYAHWSWGAAQAAIIILAAGCAWASVHAADRRPRRAVMVLAASAAIHGLVALGLKAMEWTRWGGPQVIAIDPPVPTRTAAAAKAALVSKPDATAGLKVYATACAACHGPSGAGVAGVAPGLLDSTFVSTAAETDVAALIRNGRLAGDPASKTGKPMPARGGNPFLSDADVDNIVAFLRQRGGGASAPSAQTTTTEAAAAAPRWVVPPPPSGPQGLSARFMSREQEASFPAMVQALMPTDADRVFAPMAVLLGLLQGIHLLVGIGAAIALMWQAYASPKSSAMPLARFTRSCWSAAVVLWLVLFPLLYML